MSGSTDFERKKERHASGQSNVSTDSTSNYIPTPPDGGYGWVVVMAAFFIHVIVDGVTFTFGVFYVAFQEHFQEGNARTSLVGSLLGGFYLMICFVASALVNKFGCRTVSIFGSVMSSVAFILSTFSPNVDVLMFTYGVLGGSGFALTFFPSIISVSFYFHKRRAVATGIAVCGAGVGCFVMAPLGRFLLSVYDWKNAMLIVSGIALNGCVFGALLRPLAPPKRKKRPRQKNFVDRIVEQTKRRKRAESECSACTHGRHEPNDIMKRIQEVKLAREDMLRDEDSLYEFGSVPNSTVNSFRRLDRMDSVTSTGYTPSKSISIQIPRQEVLKREAMQMGGSPSSLGMSASWNYGMSPPGMGTSAPPNFPGSPSRGMDSISMSSQLPTIIVEEDDEAGVHTCGLENDFNEDLNSSPRSENPIELTKKRTATFKTVLEEDETEVCHSMPVGMENPLLNRFKRENGAVGLKGSLPNGIACVDKLNNSTLDSSDELTSGRRRHHSKSASDVDKVTSISLIRPYVPKRIRKIDYSRPLYRKDIFYSGSMLNVTLKSQPDIITYVKSMVSIPDVVPPENESCLCRCLPKSVGDTLREMMDVTLFKEPIFLVAALGNLFAFIGLFVPFVFIADRAFMHGIDPDNAAFLLSVIGITNCLGRLIAGALADLKWVNSLLMHNVALLAGGLACILDMYCTTYALMCVFAAIFGLCIATYISLTSIVLCNLLGLERLTNAYGLLCAIRGIASIAGPPLAGAVFDLTGNYDTSFHVGGIMFLLSGVCFFSLHHPYFQRRSCQNTLEENNMNVIFVEDIGNNCKDPDSKTLDSTGLLSIGNGTLDSNSNGHMPEMV